MKKNHATHISIAVLFVLSLMLVMSCTKPSIIDNDPEHMLSFSADTVIFDTVFTTIGSTTKRLMLYNNHSNVLVIDEISLAGGENSPYRINVDGEATIKITDLEIPGGDSLYVFVRVTVDPVNQDNPLVITDSLMFYTNDNEQKVKLVSWGQDANYIVADTYIEGLPKFKIIAHENEHVHWTNNKPYVVYGYAVVDSAASLEIDPGTQIYFHSGGGLWIYTGGSIQVNGTMEEPVGFQGDRLEAKYDNLPGQWDRIIINEGPTDNIFNYAIIKNAFIGIQAEPLHAYTGNTLVINNTKILNMNGMALFTKAYRVRGTNSVFGNCGSYAAALTLGGDYDFRHCTFATFYGYNSRSTPALFINNYTLDADDNPIAVDLVNAYFGNCIVYGNMDDEVGLDAVDAGMFEYSFDHCLIKTERNLDTETRFMDCLANENPWFADSTQNFYPDTLISSAINLGAMEVINSSLFSISNDIEGISRISDEAPDAGAYEFTPER